MERRSFVSLAPVAALGGLAAAESQDPPISLAPRPYAQYDDWLAASRRASLAFIKEAGAADTERFMQFLALWAVGMPRPPLGPWEEIQGANARLQFSTLSPGRPFVVTTFKMGPGCVQPAHCHPGGGGITVCLEGSLTMRHFSLAPGQAPFKETGAEVEIEETAIARLSTNTFTLFTPTRQNLHQLEAGPEGAVCADLIVQWQGAGEFSYLRLGGGGVAASPRVGQRLKGRWVGMNIAKAYA